MGNQQFSQTLFSRALDIIPGGVNSPVRACKSVGAEPLFIKKAQGCLIDDIDGNRYIDYIGSWGPMIIGHRHEAVVKALEEAIQKGTSFGAPTDLEVELAELVIEAVPSIEMVRMVNSGTEATMSAIRLARGYTQRDKIVKFDGCYHGHADTLLVEAGSGVATLGIPGSPGIPTDVVAHTVSLPFNDIEAFETLMQQQGDTIACVIVEPVAGNMGLVPPVEGFLETLRQQTYDHGCVLIFDEVMTGFRLSYGGAQKLYGIAPDLSCLGKIIGGGLPVGAYGGKREIMSHMAPQGSVYQAGTLSGNPMAMSAGIATLKELQQPGLYEALEDTSKYLADGLKKAAAAAGIEVVINRVMSMLGLFFTNQPVTNFNDAKTCDLDRFAAYYKEMLARGIYLAPSQFEAIFVSAAHQLSDIDATIRAAEQAMARLAGERIYS